MTAHTIDTRAPVAHPASDAFTTSGAPKAAFATASKLAADTTDELLARGDLLGAMQRGLGPGSLVADSLHGLDVPELLGVVEQAEQLIAWLRYVQLAATDATVSTVAEQHELEPFEVYGPEATEKHRLLVHSVVTEELALKIGVPEFDARARVDYVTAHPEATTRLTDALRTGEVSWERARRIRERAAELPPVLADEVAARCLAPGRDGEPSTWKQFVRRLRDAMHAATDSEQRREHARKNRDAQVFMSEDGDGAATFHISGEGERVVAAAERIDATARALRRDGDPRTLAQLRSDIALDLLMHGQLPEGVEFVGALPPARLSVTVSLATLVGAADVPGEHRYGNVAAAVVRRLACQEGTTLARIVTDPLTGAAVDASTDSYRPTTAMRRFVEARDNSCRAPGCDTPAERCDLDHSVNWPHGHTTPRNLAAAHRRHHEYKTRGWWKATHHADGSITWKTLAGEYTSYPHDFDAGALAELDHLAALERLRRIHTYRAHGEQCDLIPGVTHERCPQAWSWSESGRPPTTRPAGLSLESLEQTEEAAEARELAAGLEHHKRFALLAAHSDTEECVRIALAEHTVNERKARHRDRHVRRHPHGLHANREDMNWLLRDLDEPNVVWNEGRWPECTEPDETWPDPLEPVDCSPAERH